jgi:hypothetical protein
MALQIEPELPSFFGDGDYSPELAALAGATILRIGSPKDNAERPCTLAIEFRRAGKDRSEVVMLRFNDLGLWVAN